MRNMFRNAYQGKRVLVTGHTGFKGSWLSTWLLALGANVIGYSLYVPSNPSHFDLLGLEEKLKHIMGDTRDLEHMNKVFDEEAPDMVFHLAAQAITRKAYDVPQETFFTNLGGTVNVLDNIRHSKSVNAAVMITSDKCYQNVEWVWGYRENDGLGGDDPYSASKACAEIASHSYIKSFFSEDDSPKVSTARAGNVIGGGDWAVDRIVPDCVRALSRECEIEVRNPNATRPWQHVLEPLSGYLWLGSHLLRNDKRVSGESFNFGPSSEVDRSVGQLIDHFIEYWGKGKWNTPNSNQGSQKKESNLLKLNCDKALRQLNWRAVLSFEETVEMTASWYKKYYEGNHNVYDVTINQIRKYVSFAKERGLVWASDFDWGDVE